MDAETDGMANHGGDSPPGLRRACDQCRLRKIRCDKESPCSNCRSAKRTCSSTGLGQKPKEPRQRVLISTQYEKKIDFMGDRLAVIEDLIRNLPLGGSPGQSSQPRPSFPGSSTGSPFEDGGRRPSTPSPADRRTQSSNDDDDSESSVYDDPEDAETFEGPSSLAAHAAFASDFVANATSSAVTPFSGSDARMDSALSSLRHMVSLLRNARGASEGDNASGAGWPTDGPRAQPSSSSAHPHRGRLRDLPMPPVDRVTARLRDLKSAPGPMMLLVVTCFTDMDLFTDRCRRVYFDTHKSDIPAALFIIVNAGLVYLFFEEAINAPPGPEKETLTKYTAMCRANVEAAVAQLPLLMPANVENIEALLMAASFAIDVSRPSLAWLLTSRAAHMCRALGLHLQAPLSSSRGDTKTNNTDDQAHRSLMFWSTYMLDKGLSLRLGRASVLQDYDISAPRAVAPATLQPASAPGASQAVLGLWIKHAEVQGRIYQRLYSPGALRQSDAARASQVGLIVADLQVLRRETARLCADVEARGQTREDRVFALILRSDEVSYLSSLALAYRAVPPGSQGHGLQSGGGGGRSRTFADECLDAARAAMRSHNQIIESMGETGMRIVYLHWTILYAPFIPFIVIFCHIIETAGSQTSLLFLAASAPTSSPGGTASAATTAVDAEIQADLHLLDLFIRSLDDGRASSAALAQLHHLSRVLRNVAALYVEAKTTARNQQQQQQHMPFEADFGPVGDEFDLYLSQLGFMPMDEDPGMSGGEDIFGLSSVGGGASGNPGQPAAEDVDMLRNVQLGDWFSGNNHILGLVEEDLSGFNASGW